MTSNTHEHAAQGGPIVGIDLGTTNSLVAVVRNGVPEVLKSREGERLLPSVVSFVAGKPVVGYQARRNKVRDASHTVFSVKRLLGRGFEDVAKSSSQLPYEVVPGEGVIRVKVGEQLLTAIEISAMILRELKESAEKALGETVKRAVITVPAYFNDAQRQATRAAGRLAGLEVLRIVNEPTAASLAYGLDRKKQGLIAVYDLGGGTFDVSILRLEDGIFEVLATNGNTTLGGDDLDRIFVAQAEQDIREKYGSDILKDINLKAALIEQGESAKIALSSSEWGVFQVTLPNGLTYERPWSRGEFELQARELLEATRAPCLQAIADAGLNVSDLSDVVLVGGPTRLQVVQQVAESIFKRKPNTSVHPDEVVAAGAAIQADILAGNTTDLLLLDVIPLSLGIETYGGLMAPLIPRNTRIPASARETFTTFMDRQTGVDIHVLQGERDRASENRSLARFKLKGIEPLPAGMPRIEVNFLIDADGILQVAAKDLRTGSEQAIEVRPSFGLSDAEVERMLAAQAESSESDKAFRKLVDARTEAEPVLRNTEKHLEKARRLLTPEEYAQVDACVQALRTAMAGESPEAIVQAKYALNAVTVRLAELVIADSLRQAST